MSKSVKVYPVRGHFLIDVPHRVQEIETTARAEELIATGAFTDNPNHPERDMSAPDDTKPAPAIDQPAPADFPTLSGTPAGPSFDTEQLAEAHVVIATAKET